MIPAGVYCGRTRLKTLIIEEALADGLATRTNEIENYPGFPEGSTGLGLMELFHRQAKKFGVVFKLTDVRSVKLEGADKIVETFRSEYHRKGAFSLTAASPASQARPARTSICMIRAYPSAPPATRPPAPAKPYW